MQVKSVDRVETTFPPAEDDEGGCPFTGGCLHEVDPSFRALSGRLKFTVRRHKFNKDSLSGRLLRGRLLLFSFTLVTGPRRSLSLKLSDTRVYVPQIRARLGPTGRRDLLAL